MPPPTHPPLLAKHIAKNNLKMKYFVSVRHPKPATHKADCWNTKSSSSDNNRHQHHDNCHNHHHHHDQHKIIIIIIIITSRGAMVWGEVGKWKAKPQRPRLVSYLQWTGALHHHHRHHYPRWTEALYRHHYQQQHHHHYALLHCSFMKLVKYHGEDEALYEGLCVLV